MSYANKTGSLWVYSNDEEINLSYDIVNGFVFKFKLIGETVNESEPNNDSGILKNATTAVLLKYLNNFWRSLKMPLINCKFELNTNVEDIVL